MRARLSEIVLALAGGLFGLLLYFISSAFPRPTFGGASFWGFPLTYGVTGGTCFGNCSTFTPQEPAFAADLVFWIAVGVVTAEVLARKILPNRMDESWPWAKDRETMDVESKWPGKVLSVLLVGLIIGMAFAFFATSTAGVFGMTATVTTTSTVTTTAPPGSSTSVNAPDDGVDLEGCSLTTKTCTFLIQNFDLMDGYAITLGRDGMCVTATYTSPTSVSSFVNEDAGCTTPSNSTYIANNGATTVVTAVFSGWSPGAGSNEPPTAGQSIWGCILYTSGDGFGCLAFTGVFTNSGTTSQGYLTTTQVVTSTVTVTATSP